MGRLKVDTWSNHHQSILVHSMPNSLYLWSVRVWSQNKRSIHDIETIPQGTDKLATPHVRPRQVSYTYELPERWAQIGRRVADKPASKSRNRELHVPPFKPPCEAAVVTPVVVGVVKYWKLSVIQGVLEMSSCHWPFTRSVWHAICHCERACIYMETDLNRSSLPMSANCRLMS